MNVGQCQDQFKEAIVLTAEADDKVIPWKGHVPPINSVKPKEAFKYTNWDDQTIDRID